MEDLKGNKISRILSIYNKLLNGKTVNKTEEARSFGVNMRSIQRDIDDIRAFLENCTYGTRCQIIYDRNEKGYRLECVRQLSFQNSEVLALCKILLDSRAFTKLEIESMIDRLIECCIPPENRSLIHELIQNEKFHYIEPRHHTKFIDKVWEIGQAIHENNYIEITYFRLKDKSEVMRKLKPVAIMFSEYYFYLTAFIDDEDEARQDFDVLNDSFPTIYRLDRIKKLKILNEKFYIPYRNRFEEGEFRKRIQFMYGGKLRHIRFEYSGLDVDAVLDRLPTAQIVSENNGVYTITAEVFGNGIDMWIRSQGENVKLLY